MLKGINYSSLMRSMRSIDSHVPYPINYCLEKKMNIMNLNIMKHTCFTIMFLNFQRCFLLVHRLVLWHSIKYLQRNYFIPSLASYNFISYQMRAIKQYHDVVAETNLFVDFPICFTVCEENLPRDVSFYAPS